MDGTAHKLVSSQTVFYLNELVELALSVVYKSRGLLT